MAKKKQTDLINWEQKAQEYKNLWQHALQNNKDNAEVHAGNLTALKQVTQQRDEAISQLHSAQRELQFTKESAKAHEVSNIAESVVPKLIAELDTTRDALRAINTLWLLKDAQSEKTGI